MGSLPLGSLAVLGFLLAGCGHMPVTSMIKLAQIDFTSTDPALWRAAVKLPQTLQPRTQAMVLRISVRASNGQELKQEFALQDFRSRGSAAASRRGLTRHTRVRVPDRPRRLAAPQQLPGNRACAAASSGRRNTEHPAASLPERRNTVRTDHVLDLLADRGDPAIHRAHPRCRFTDARGWSRRCGDDSALQVRRQLGPACACCGERGRVNSAGPPASGTFAFWLR